MATLSSHAQIRKKQRDIADSSIHAVVESGEKLKHETSTVFIDKSIKVVCSDDCGRIITVCKNNRNTLFQLSERTKEKEQSLLHKVKSGKNDNAMCELAELYSEGSLGKINNQKAFRLFSRAAEKGNSHAMCRISELYSSGALGKPNEKLADQWMRKAADRNNIYALAIIGQRLLCEYIKKYPVNSNIFRPSAPKKEILNYLQRSAEKGSTRAIWQLGEIYEEGYFGDKDLSKAIELYVKAAKTGSPASLDSLHNFTFQSKFKKEELEDILDGLSYLVTTSMGMALQLGLKQLNGRLGYNPMRGFKMVEQVALLKQNDGAIRALAEDYRLKENLILAQYWYNELYDLYDNSAKSGNVSSLWKLGELYLDGYIDNIIDLEKAEKCFTETIEQTSNPDEIYKLGMLYFEGRLGDKPISVGMQLIEQAIKIWKFQATKGNTEVYCDIGGAYYSIGLYKNAVYWYSKTPSDVTSLMWLVEIYLDNSCPERNIPLGLKILQNLILLEQEVDTDSTFEIYEISWNDDIKRCLQNMLDQTIQQSSDAIEQPDNVNNEQLLDANKHPNVNEQINVNKQTNNVSNKESNKNIGYKKSLLQTLAATFEKRNRSGEIDYELASKYYHQLYVEFENVSAAIKLIWFYDQQKLPEKYHNFIKDWVLNIPTLLKTNTDIICSEFKECILLLGKMCQIGDNIFPLNVQEAFKWLTVASYMFDKTDVKSKQIEEDLKRLAHLDVIQNKEQTIIEFSEMVQDFKTKSLVKFRWLSRVLGDMNNDDKVVNRNIEKSIYWYTESSNMGNSLASLALAKIYYYDKKDINESVKWYMLSARQGGKNALKALKTIQVEEKLDDLSLFLDKYEYQSTIKDSELVGIKPFKNLKSYPETTQEMIELGKSLLKSGKEENRERVLNAAYWFREAMTSGSVTAAVELCSMYNSGILGTNFKPVVHYLKQNILNMFCDELKFIATSRNTDSSLLYSLLNDLFAMLKTYDLSSDSLKNKLEILMNETEHLDYKMFAELLSDLEQLELELSLKNSEIICDKDILQNSE